MSPADRDVLTSLPSTRPTQRSAKRDAAKAKPKPKARKAAAPQAEAPRVPPPAAGWATPGAPAPRQDGVGSLALLATAVQAAGELATLALKEALRRLPRP